MHGSGLPDQSRLEADGILRTSPHVCVIRAPWHAATCPKAYKILTKKTKHINASLRVGKCFQNQFAAAPERKKTRLPERCSFQDVVWFLAGVGCVCGGCVWFFNLIRHRLGPRRLVSNLVERVLDCLNILFIFLILPHFLFLIRCDRLLLRIAFFLLARRART